ncbi:protein lethal(2)essential for life-like [Argiope bruennichi]|uniref:protein lethal(2)essential for life-like n=1 Tax=Argiope bruennichi TaxID=94029 RepID=UPI0024959936|nr:protein lethal(2)essential for life-like [Argiope bruennichi]
MSRPLRKRNVPSEKEQEQAQAQELEAQKTDSFQTAFYMKHFRATDIIVKVADYTLIIDASHREHADEHGLVTRSMIRKHKLPKDIKIATLRCSFTGSGFLVVHAER